MYTSRNRFKSPALSRSPSRKSFARFGRGRGPVDVPIESFIQKASAAGPATAPERPVTLQIADLPIHETIKRNMKSHGYTGLMPIQEQAIPAVLSGRDVIGIANTGTGKTAAFLLPIIDKVLKNPAERALIVTPTRELAMQIREELIRFSVGLPIRNAFIIGQSSMGLQLRDLARRPSVIVGTPGRLLDLMERGNLKTSELSVIVLDEADQMLDMGFLPAIRRIVAALPAKRQSLFFSATVSREVERLIHTFVHNPVTVSVKKRETTSHIHQKLIKVKWGTKKETLKKMLKENEFTKVLVFGRTKRGVERLSRDLHMEGYPVASIHGDKPQRDRQTAIRHFKEDQVTILVATDVAARGLDIANISHVINYDLPATYEDYIHRIGRTGRAMAEGHALSLVEE